MVKVKKGIVALGIVVGLVAAVLLVSQFVGSQTSGLTVININPGFVALAGIPTLSAGSSIVEIHDGITKTMAVGTEINPKTGQPALTFTLTKSDARGVQTTASFTGFDRQRMQGASSDWLISQLASPILARAPTEQATLLYTEFQKIAVVFPSTTFRFAKDVPQPMGASGVSLTYLGTKDGLTHIVREVGSDGVTRDLSLAQSVSQTFPISDDLLLTLHLITVNPDGTITVKAKAERLTPTTLGLSQTNSTGVPTRTVDTGILSASVRELRYAIDGGIFVFEGGEKGTSLTARRYNPDMVIRYSRTVSQDAFAAQKAAGAAVDATYAEKLADGTLNIKFVMPSGDTFVPYAPALGAAATFQRPTLLDECVYFLEVIKTTFLKRVCSDRSQRNVLELNELPTDMSSDGQRLWMLFGQQHPGVIKAIDPATGAAADHILATSGDAILAAKKDTDGTTRVAIRRVGGIDVYHIGSTAQLVSSYNLDLTTLGLTTFNGVIVDNGLWVTARVVSPPVPPEGPPQTIGVITLLLETASNQVIGLGAVPGAAMPAPAVVDADGDGCNDINERETAQNGRTIDAINNPNVCHDAPTHTGRIKPEGVAEIKDSLGNVVQRITNRGTSDDTYGFATVDGRFVNVNIPSATGAALLETLTDGTTVLAKGGNEQPTICELTGSVKCQMSTSSRLIFPTLNDKEVHAVSGILNAAIEGHTDALLRPFYDLRLFGGAEATIEYNITRRFPVRINFGLGTDSALRAFLGGGSFDDKFLPEAGSITAACTPSSDDAGDKCFYGLIDNFVRTEGGVSKQLVSTGSETLTDPTTSTATLGPVNAAGLINFLGAKVLDPATGAAIADFSDPTPTTHTGSGVNELILAPKGRKESVVFNGATCGRTLQDQTQRTLKRFATSGPTTTCMVGKSVTGSLLNIYEPEAVPIAPGQTAEVPFIYESVDPAWQIVTAPTAPSDCTISPGSQEVQVSTDGTLQTKALVWQLTCSSTAATGLIQTAIAAGGKGNGHVTHDVTFRDQKKGGKVKKHVRLEGDFEVIEKPGKKR